jgi:hypothetical protein
LYGKQEEKEGTGVSIIFKESFFSDNIQGFAAPSLPAMDGISNKENDEPKIALFRCMYVDPETQQVIHIGQKEEYALYRDEKTDDEVDKYRQDMITLLKEVRKAMKKLRETIVEYKLEPENAGKLLIELRCLTKHVAFKEEQECRIVKLMKRTDDKVQPTGNYRQLYTDYLPLTGHVKEICFGPHVDNWEVYAAELMKEKYGRIPSSQSTHPLA